MKGMMNQFVSLYDATVQGKDLATVPSPEFSYVDFSIWQ